MMNEGTATKEAMMTREQRARAMRYIAKIPAADLAQMPSDEAIQLAHIAWSAEQGDRNLPDDKIKWALRGVRIDGVDVDDIGWLRKVAQ